MYETRIKYNHSTKSLLKEALKLFTIGSYTEHKVIKTGYEDLNVKFLLNGEVRSTSYFTLQESWTGYGNYKQTTASKAGTWEILVLRGDSQLASAKVNVVE